MLDLMIRQAAASAPGTGDFPLGAVDAGFAGLSDSVIPQGVVFTYLITEGNGDSELGRGSHNGVSLSRDYVIRTSVGGVLTWASTPLNAAVPKLNATSTATVSLVFDGTAGGGSHTAVGWGNGNTTSSDVWQVSPYAYHALSNTLTTAANKYYFTPMRFDTFCVLSELGVSVSTAGTAGTVTRIALMGCEPDYGRPKGIVAQTDNLLVDVAGSVNGAILGGDIMIPPGEYWFMIIADAAVTFRAHDRTYFYCPRLGSSSSGTYPWNFTHTVKATSYDWVTNGVEDHPYAAGTSGGNATSNQYIVKIRAKASAL